METHQVFVADEIATVPLGWTSEEEHGLGFWEDDPIRSVHLIHTGGLRVTFDEVSFTAIEVRVDDGINPVAVHAEWPEVVEWAEDFTTSFSTTMANLEAALA